MGIKVSVNSISKTRVSLNNTEKNTVRSVGISPSVPVNELRNLLDVNASSLDNNETIVYDGTSGEFIVKTLPIINGGNF